MAMAIREEVLEQLLEGYQKPEDIMGQNGLLKQLSKALLEKMLAAELTTHLGYEKHDPAGYGSGNSRNGSSKKKVKGEVGEIELSVPRDRAATFEPKIVPKGQTRFTGFDDKILSLYARGMTTRDIQAHLEEMYQVEVSPALISNVTDAVLEEVQAWQGRPLEQLYPIVYLDALYVKMRDNGHVQNRAIYTAIAITLDGNKEVLGLWTSANEGAKFWLQVLTELQNRGVKDILIACIDGLKGFPEAIETVFPKTQVQLCIVHLVRASLNYVNWKERKRVAADLREIYRAPSALQAEQHLAGIRRAMGGQVSDDCGVVAPPLGTRDSVLRLSCRDSPGHLYDERHRVVAHDLAQSDQDARLISQRRGGAQAALPGAAQHI